MHTHVAIASRPQTVVARYIAMHVYIVRIIIVVFGTCACSSYQAPFSRGHVTPTVPGDLCVLRVLSSGGMCVCVCAFMGE